MEGLMSICTYFGSKNCHPDIRQFRKSQIEKTGKNRAKLLTEDNLIRFDEICKSCKVRLFKIEKKKCPVCKNTNIKLSNIVDIESPFGSLKGNLYICNNCNTKLISEQIF
jgi:hypothetical protein